MLDDEGLILIAHSDARTLMALYAFLDAEGYFVAPCFSKGDLLQYCARYKPGVIMTNNPLSGDEGDRLLVGIKERSPNTRIVLLPEVREPGSTDVLLEPCRREDILRIVEALSAPQPPVYLN